MGKWILLATAALVVTGVLVVADVMRGILL